MFFENFARICKEKGTSPTVVVSKLGMSKNTASYWKKNGNLPNDEQLQEMANILNCDVADFFSRSDTFVSAVANVRNHVENGTIGDVITSLSTAPANDPMGILSDDERELVNMYRKLSVIDRARLMVTVDEMANGSNRA